MVFTPICLVLVSSGTLFLKVFFTVLQLFQEKSIKITPELNCTRIIPAFLYRTVWQVVLAGFLYNFLVRGQLPSDVKMTYLSKSAFHQFDLQQIMEVGKKNKPNQMLPMSYTTKEY